MTNVLLIIAYFGVLLALTKPLGLYMYRLFNGERTFLSPVLRPAERGIYRLTAVDESREMRWTTYLVALLLFNFFGFLAVYLLQRLQSGLPFNPQALPGVEPASSFNTAVSFMTNTNWQGYYP
jgi:potassium-transporting ATPase potassium-binding subunit